MKSLIIDHQSPIIILTGCAGFIGSHLLDRLLENSYKVIGIDDFNDYYSPKQKRKNIKGYLNNKNFVLVEKDVCNLSVSDIPLIINHQSLIIHLAARAGVRASINQPLLYQKVNVAGTLSLLELAKKLSVKHFIFGSSSSVYGNNTSMPFREDAACDQPISPYAATKRSAELLCYTYHKLYKIPVTILRFFTVYGPRNRPDMAAFKFMDSIVKGKPIDFYGQNTSRDYTFVSDIVDGIMAAINFTPDNFEIFNLGNSTPIGLSEFIHTIEETIGNKAILVKKNLPQGDVRTTYADISKAEKILEWQPNIPLKDGLKQLWDWYQINIE